MSDLIIYIAIWVVAFIVGIIVGKITKKEATVGTIIIDCESVPEDEPYLFLETRTNPRAFMTKKSVSFDVSVNKLVSHK